MAAQQYSIPTENAADKDGSDIAGGWAPGVGSVPLGAGTVQTSNEGGMGTVTYAARLTETGGTAYKVCAAATAVAVKASAGRLCKVIVITSGTAAVSIYDNASAASGNVLFTVPASAAVGSVYALDIPATAGIYVGGTTNTPALNCTYF